MYQQTRAHEVLNLAIEQLEAGNIPQGCDTLISAARLLDDMNWFVIRAYHRQGCVNYGQGLLHTGIKGIINIKEAVRMLKLNGLVDVNEVLNVLRGKYNFLNGSYEIFLKERYKRIDDSDVGELEL